MWPILLCSVAALAIAIERLLALSRVEIDSEHFLERIKKEIHAGRPAQARHLCEASGTPLARMVKAGLKRTGRPRSEIRENLEEAGAREVLSLQRYVPLLGTIAHLAPLLGLLGTVTGLIRCFQVIQEKAATINPVNPGDLAGGIWEALLTTVFGLTVAIPAYAIYNYFVHRINGLVNDLETSGSELLDLLTEEEPAPSKDPSAGLRTGPSASEFLLHAT